jgi:hypothetical protein
MGSQFSELCARFCEKWIREMQPGVVADWLTTRPARLCPVWYRAAAMEPGQSGVGQPAARVAPRLGPERIWGRSRPCRSVAIAILRIPHTPEPRAQIAQIPRQHHFPHHVPATFRYGASCGGERPPVPSVVALLITSRAISTAVTAVTVNRIQFNPAPPFSLAFGVGSDVSSGSVVEASRRLHWTRR